MYKRGGYCLGGGIVKSGADLPEVMSVPVAGFTGSRDLIVECKVCVEEKAEVACRWSGFDNCGCTYLQCGIIEFGQLVWVAKD